MSPLVFISHASADRKLADAICVALELRGIPCWIATRDVPWFQKAAQQGLAISQLNIGFLYQDGLGVGQDYSQAMTWYQKAAQQHLPPRNF
jgi:TPR repeat protein